MTEHMLKMSTKKPKAVFICRNMGTVLDVYCEAVMKKLRESLDFVDPITKEEEIYARRMSFLPSSMLSRHGECFT